MSPKQAKHFRKRGVTYSSEHFPKQEGCNRKCYLNCNIYRRGEVSEI